MINIPITYHQADYMHAIKCLKEITVVSPNHPNIECYINNTINCLRFFPMLNIPEDWFIVRMRTGWHEDNEEQYSYPHDKKFVKLGRANLLEDPIFYGSVTDTSTNVFESSGINAMEIADKAFENGHCRMRITMSCWRTKRPLIVFPVIHPSLYNDLAKENNLFVAKLINGYEEHRAEWSREEAIDDLTLQINDKIYEYWSGEFQRQIIDGNYQKTAYFTKIMLNEQHKWSKERKIYDGILYPSHKTYGRIGCNIAVRQDVVDAQFELMVKGRGTLYVNQQSAKTKRLLQLEYDQVKLNGKWVEENILEQKGYNESDLCEDLSIKNIEELEWIE